MNNDLISRKAAIKMFYDIPLRGMKQEGEYLISLVSLPQVLNALEQLPPAQPERKTGRWLRYGEDGYPNNEDTVFWQCDQCLEQYTGRTKRIPNFCPNCGADMREET